MPVARRASVLIGYGETLRSKLRSGCNASIHRVEEQSIIRYVFRRNPSLTNLDDGGEAEKLLC